MGNGGPSGMRLSRETRYALQGLTALAGRPRGAVVESRALARESGTPPFYLAKIMQTLARAGIVDSFRGRGYALPRPPAEITLHDVVCAIDGDDGFWEGCIFWREECSEAAPCPLHHRWRDLRPVFNDAVGGITLADLRDGVLVKEPNA
jgi:Rrf2 family protein